MRCTNGAFFPTLAPRRTNMMISLTLASIYRSKLQVLNGVHSPLDYGRESLASHEKERRMTRLIRPSIPLPMRVILPETRKRFTSMSRDDSSPVARKMQKDSKPLSQLPSTVKSFLPVAYWFSSGTTSKSFPTTSGRATSCLPLRKEKSLCPPSASSGRVKRQDLPCSQRQIWSA